MYDEFKAGYRLPIKILSAFLAVLMVFSGGLISCYAQGLGVPDKIETQEILSDYADEIVDTSGVKSVDTEKSSENELYLNMKDGSTTVYEFSEPVLFTDDDGQLRFKDNSIVEQTDKEKAALGYDYSNTQNDYKINISSDSSKGVLVEYEDTAFSLSAISDINAPGYISKGMVSGEELEDFEYSDLFGSNTLLKYFFQLNGIKEEIMLDQNIGKNSFSFLLKTKNCTPVSNEDGSISLLNSENETIQSFAVPFAYDADYVEGIADEHYCPDCTYAIEKSGENQYVLTVTISKDWLDSDSTVYPVTIDPTTDKLLSGMDVPIHSKRTTSGTQNDNNAVGVSAQYGASRTLVYMGWPGEIQKTAKINSAYYYARELTGRTSNMGVEVYKVTSHWNNDTSWSTRPDWDPKRLDWVNINGNYNGGGTYWYKFNITSAVQDQISGAENRGFMLKYDDEDGAANLRTFAQKEYSTSSMRPYVVINYTNDTTAPTVTSVTKSPSTAWSNSDVTITVNGAKDSGSGLAASAYSFSTDPNKTNWQASNKFVVKSSCHVWVHVRDNAGNSNYCACIRVDIDRKAPEISGVSKTDNGNKSVTVTVSAQDADSGIAGYSFDGGKTWQSSSSADLSINAKPVIKVKDNAGNITEYKETAVPEIYSDNNLVYIYTSGTAEYKIADGSWQTYSHPFSVPVGRDVTVYARDKGNPSSQVSKTVKNTIGEYTESAADMSISYYGASFDVSRNYDSNSGWFDSLYSNIDLLSSTDNVIYAVLPDGSRLAFERTLSSNVFINKFTNYTLIKSDDKFIINTNDTEYTFDATGVLSAVSDPSGNAITFTKNRDNKIIAITAGSGRTYTVAYNSDGTVQSVTDPLGESVKYEYSDGKLTKAYWDKESFVIKKSDDIILGEYQYDSNGRLSKSFFSNITYNSNGQVVQELDDSGSYTNYTYSGEVYSYPSDSDDETADPVNVTVVTADSSNETSTITKYNDALLTVSATDSDGNTTDYKYDTSFRLISEQSGDNETSYTYDEDGNVLTSSSADSQTVYTYNSDDQPVTQVSTSKDDNGNETKSYTKYEYSNGVVSRITQSAKEDYSNAVTGEYSNGLLVRSTDATDPQKITVTEYTYDQYGNVLSTVTTTVSGSDSSSDTVNYTYDALNHVLTQTDKDGTTSYVYDAAGNIISQTDKTGTQRTLIDEYGRTVQSIAPEDYDAAKDGLNNDRSADTYSDSSAGSTYKYASNGTLTSETNRLGKTTKYYYNDRGAKVREEFDIYKFYYLNHGELYQVKVANVTTVSYSYSTDGKYDLLQETYANDDSIRYTYDANGNVTAQYKNDNSKPYVTYTYDSDGNLSEKVNTDAGLKYVYGENNKVDVYRLSDNTLVQSYSETETDADNAAGTEAYTSVTEDHFGNSYSYVSKDKSIEYNSGADKALYSYETDSQDRTTSDSVKYNGSSVASSEYTYDDNGNITKKAVGYSNAGSLKYYRFAASYDDKNRITGYGYTRPSDVYVTYDEQGQISRVNSRIVPENKYTATYKYDSRGNITAKDLYPYTSSADISASPTETTTFTYANSGWKDQLVAVNGVELTYDANGNVLTYGNREYSWTNGRDLAGITDGDNIYSYAYDENGIRTSKTVNGKTTYYNTSNGVILSQTDGTDTWYFQYDTNGVPMGFILNGVQYFYLTNQMGDVISIVDTNGVEIAGYEYDEWGKPILAYAGDESDATQVKIANANPILYRGYYYDYETGYYYLQSRYYDPSICRFINADSAEMAYQFINSPIFSILYCYCDNDPINNIDLEGCRRSQLYIYSAKAAKYYAEFWWNKYNPLYKTANKNRDCANFVSQCLYAGGEPLNSTWYNNRIKISSAWGDAIKLYQYLKKSRVSKEYIIKKYSDVDTIGRILYSMPTCSAVLFIDNESNGSIDHAMLSGQIIRGGSQNRSYDIFYYAHSNACRGTEYINGKRNKKSLKQLYNTSKYRKMRVYVLILKTRWTE